MSLVEASSPGIFWQSRMGNNRDGIGGNCHRYDIVTGDGLGNLGHGRFVVDLGIKMGHRGGYSCELPTPEGLLVHEREGLKAGEPVPAALLLTHAHEDHLGAIRHALDMGFRIPPIYCTAFTAEMVKKSLTNAGIEKSRRPDINVVRAGDVVEVAKAKVEFVPVDHLPGATALLIRTPEATVFHTGDYKFDDTLLLGDRADPRRLAEIGREGVDMVVADSTAVPEKCAKVTEAQIRRHLTDLVADNKGRAVVAGILGTQLDRLVSLGQAAAANDRVLVVTGRSLVDNVAAARLAGMDIAQVAGAALLTAQQAMDLTADKAIVVTTGAFAQPRAGLTRAADRLPGALWMGEDTTVIIPQRAIPSVAHAQAEMVAKLEMLGATVVTAERAEEMQYGAIHQSGHAIEKDTKLLYSLLRPKQVVAPMHGNGVQLEANARIAKSLGFQALPIDRNGAIVHVSGKGAEVLGYEDVHRIGVAETDHVKVVPRARPGEGRKASGPPQAYRYDELAADGRTLVANHRYSADAPTRLKPPSALSASHRAGLLRGR